MGQQQLLLIVLGVIIVGVAIVAGIGLFNAGSEEAVKDELVSQCMNIGANAQQWFKKPVAMGGGGGSFSMSGGSTVVYTIPPKMQYTSNASLTGLGGYTIMTPGDAQIVIRGTNNTVLNYAWHVECTVTADNVTTRIIAGH